MEARVEKPEAVAAAKPPRPAKKRGALTLVRAVLFMVRRGKKATSMQTGVVVKSGGKGLWHSLICGVGPLQQHDRHHIEHSVSPLALPPPPEDNAVAVIFPPPSPDAYHDMPLPPASPVSSVDGLSRYVSAEDLYILDKSEECNDGEEDAGVGSPNAIDMMAEDFIAKFYEQVRLQRMQSMALRCL